jgi:ATP-binding cassette subfamily B protein RaxB
MDLLTMRRQRLPVLRQTEASECGLVCLAMVLNYHGHRIDLATLRQRHVASAQGLNLRGLIALASRLQLAARPLRLELDELAKLRLPAILHWDLNHFVVLESCRAGRAVIHDPASGLVVCDTKLLDQHFSGVALELTPMADFTPRDERQQLRLANLWRQHSGLWSGLGYLFLLSLLLQLFSLALPFYTQIFIDEVLVSQDFALLKILATGFFMVTVVRCFSEWLRAQLVLHLASSVGFQIAGAICRHLLHLPLSWFSRRHPGDIVSRFGSLTQVRDFLSSGIVEVLIDGLMVAGTLGLMLVYSLPLTLVALVAVVAYALLRVALHGRLRRHNEALLQAAAQENSVFLENLRAIQGIRLFSKQADRLALWQNLHADVVNAGADLQKLGFQIRLANGLLLGTENIVLMLLGGIAVLRNDLSIGMIMAYLSFKDQFYGRVFALIDKVFEYRLLELHLERLADIALAPVEQHLEGLGVPPPEVCLQGGLSIQELSFRYDADGPWLLRDISFTVDNEEVVAIIGPTGCGKSTLLKLVLSLLQPSAGAVLLHGMPVHRMGLHAYRERVAAVLQDDALLSGSIFDNISFFDPAPDREQVELCANLAALANDIRALPMQYNTLVGSMGAALSGGQVQRLLLARALYKRPRLLVLDEATSHLDLATEQAVNRAIRQLRIARLIVAHRTETILQADRILELTPQGLIELKHAELQARRAPMGWLPAQPPV